MDLSCGHFYKTIEEAETAIKQYSKEHYFIRLNHPRRIKKIYSSGFPTNNGNLYHFMISWNWSESYF